MPRAQRPIAAWSPVKLRSPLKVHGGKSYLARRIIDVFPTHNMYVEPFAGGLSVLLNKKKSWVEVASDLSPDIVNLWSWIADPALAAMINATEYSEASFREATAIRNASIDENGWDAKRAWAFLVNNRMSRGGLGKDFAWSERLRGRGRSGGPVPGDVNAWETFRESLPAIALRMKSVLLRRQDAIQTINELDGPGTLFYCDPPYVHSTRTAKKTYDFEMTNDQHLELLDQLLAARGKVVLSGYANAMYDQALRGWRRLEFEMPNHSGQGETKQRRTECLWVKP